MKRVFDGLSLVALGLVLLGMTTGVIEWSALLNIVSLWPLLLVAAGIDLIGKSLGSAWVRALSSVVFIGGLVYAVFVMPADGWPGVVGFRPLGREPAAFAGSVPAPTAGLADAELRVGSWAGRVALRASEATADVIAWEGRSSASEPDVDVSREASSAVVRVDMPEGPGLLLGRPRDERTEFALARGVPWTIRMASGAGELRADLSRLQVDELRVDSGVGAADVKLPRPLDDGSRMVVDSGIAGVTLALPDDAGARLRFDTGIGSHDLPDGFRREGDWWVSPGFDAGSPSWEVVFGSGIGSVNVTTY